MPDTTQPDDTADTPPPPTITFTVPVTTLRDTERVALIDTALRLLREQLLHRMTTATYIDDCPGPTPLNTLLLRLADPTHRHPDDEPF